MGGFLFLHKHFTFTWYDDIWLSCHPLPLPYPPAPACLTPPPLLIICWTLTSHLTPLSYWPHHHITAPQTRLPLWPDISMNHTDRNVETQKCWNTKNVETHTKNILKPHTGYHLFHCIQQPIPLELIREKKHHIIFSGSIPISETDWLSWFLVNSEGGNEWNWVTWKFCRMEESRVGHCGTLTLPPPP